MPGDPPSRDESGQSSTPRVLADYGEDNDGDGCDLIPRSGIAHEQGQDDAVPPVAPDSATAGHRVDNVAVGSTDVDNHVGNSGASTVTDDGVVESDPPAVGNHGAATTDDEAARGVGASTPPPLAKKSLVSRKVEYLAHDSSRISLEDMPDLDFSEEPMVPEHIEVRYTNAAARDGVRVAYSESTKGRAYMQILSPAVNEALRCVVDYFPEMDLAAHPITIKEPYAVFVFFEKQLTEYRERLRDTAEDGANPAPVTCANRYAYKHIGIAQDFVRSLNGKAVDEERERHARGMCTFSMLWLLFKPGTDVMYDIDDCNEHRPYVASRIEITTFNHSIQEYGLHLWNMDATSEYVGPCSTWQGLDRFPGEKKISDLRAYPVEYLRFADGMTEDDVPAIRDFFTQRGRKWYQMRKKAQCYSFDGYSASTPKYRFTGRVMVDPPEYASDVSERVTLMKSIEHPSPAARLCNCSACLELIYNNTAPPRFTGYYNINPLLVDEMTDHQYFVAEQSVEAFVFSIREWRVLSVDGFRPVEWDDKLIDHLVLKDSTKTMIKDLITMYFRQDDKASQILREDGPKEFIPAAAIHRQPKPQAKPSQEVWVPDFIPGKGESLIFLLHGRPGVGKTYTAECVSNYAKRPLMYLCCSDIGVDPVNIEAHLQKWFNISERWGVIMLIDEADVYMEERKVQDVDRNHLVAGFIRALEYYKGILFLTTNRIGTFDEAFMSRINVPIYYRDFGQHDRAKIWGQFFERLEDERGDTMRIPESTKDYVESEEMQALGWNGREIRNAFQIAVALAESQGHKDKDSRIVIKREHLKATVQMSKDFGKYIKLLQRGPPSKKAAILGNRFDAYDAESDPAGQADSGKHGRLGRSGGFV